MGEDWLPIPGYEESYDVSDLGRVRSLDRVVMTKRGAWAYKGRILRPAGAPDGYLTVRLGLPGPSRSWAVHLLVLMAFGDPRPQWAQCVRHLDGNSRNNAVSNLAWGTWKEQADDRVTHGTAWYL